MERWGGTMSMELYRKVIDDSLTIPQIKHYVLHGLGEPALDRHMIDRVKYIRERSDRPIEIYTNGIHMGPDRLDALAAAGLSTIVFSVNAVRADQHDSIMGTKGKYETVVANALHAIHKTNLYVECHAVESERFSRLDTALFRIMWGDNAVVVQKNNWAGDIESPNVADDTTPCTRAITQIYVMYDGRVTMCCLDPSGKTIFGDLRTQSIREIYNSPSYVAFRQAHAEGRAAEYTACKGWSRT